MSSSEMSPVHWLYTKASNNNHSASDNIETGERLWQTNDYRKSIKPLHKHICECANDLSVNSCVLPNSQQFCNESAEDRPCTNCESNVIENSTLVPNCAFISNSHSLELRGQICECYLSGLCSVNCIVFGQLNNISIGSNINLSNLSNKFYFDPSSQFASERMVASPKSDKESSNVLILNELNTCKSTGSNCFKKGNQSNSDKGKEGKVNILINHRNANLLNGDEIRKVVHNKQDNPNETTERADAENCFPVYSELDIKLPQEKDDTNANYESNLDRVEKMLQDVLWKKPQNKDTRIGNNYAIAESPVVGGSDTGYSSRSSTPPLLGANLQTSSTSSRKRGERFQFIEDRHLNYGHSDDDRLDSLSDSKSECSDESSNSSHYYRDGTFSHNERKSNTGFHHNQNSRWNSEKKWDHDGWNHGRFSYNGRPSYYGRNGDYGGYNKSYPNKSQFQNHVNYLNARNNFSHYNSLRYIEKPHKAYENKDISSLYKKQDSQWQQEDGYNYQNTRNLRGHVHIAAAARGCPRHYPIPHNVTIGYHSYHDQREIANYQLHSHHDVRDVDWPLRRQLEGPSGRFLTPDEVPFDAEITTLKLKKNCVGVSAQIFRLFKAHEQLDTTFRRKMELKAQITRVIKNVLPMCRLFVVGSSLSGFGTNTSDVDMCLMVTPRDLNQRNEAQSVLRLLQGELNNCGFVEKMELITAKVPILKFCDSVSKIEVDLNCNNSVGIRNTHLLNAYSQLDWRVRPLVLVVKLWAQRNNINNAKDMTISSYSLVLMVIHFLQNGLEVPVLPCLHKSFPDKFNDNNSVFRMPVTERMPFFQSKNVQSLRDLLIGFLDYYGYKFKFMEHTISVRVGGIIPTALCKIVKVKKNDPRMWQYLCIEEPFDLTNTARSVYDEAIFDKVKNCFRRSYADLTSSDNLDVIMRSVRTPNEFVDHQSDK